MASTRLRSTKKLSSTGSRIFVLREAAQQPLHLVDDALRALAAPAALVEGGVVAEAAAAGAAAAGLQVDAPGLERRVERQRQEVVGQLDRDGVEVDEGRVRGGADGGAGAVAAAGRERDAGDGVERLAGRQRVGQRPDDELALAADDDVHARVRGRLLGQERGVHAAPHDGRARPLRAHALGELEAVADLRAAHRRDADEHGVAERQGAEVAEAQVGDARAVARRAQRRGHVQQLQRHLGVGRALAAREDEQDLPGLTHRSPRRARRRARTRPDRRSTPRASPSCSGSRSRRAW